MQALSDPTRLQVFERLRDGPHAVGELAQHLPVSRPAVSQHLRVLLDAGLVQVDKVGRQRLYRIDPSGLEELRAWLDSFWDDALTRYATTLLQTTQESE